MQHITKPAAVFEALGIDQFPPSCNMKRIHLHSKNSQSSSLVSSALHLKPQTPISFMSTTKSLRIYFYQL